MNKKQKRTLKNIIISIVLLIVITIIYKLFLQDIDMPSYAKRIIAIQDRNKHNKPLYPYGVCKIFVECEVIGGEFAKNIETTEIKGNSHEKITREIWQRN